MQTEWDARTSSFGNAETAYVVWGSMGLVQPNLQSLWIPCVPFCQRLDEDRIVEASMGGQLRRVLSFLLIARVRFAERLDELFSCTCTSYAFSSLMSFFPFGRDSTRTESSRLPWGANSDAFFLFFLLHAFALQKGSMKKESFLGLLS